MTNKTYSIVVIPGDGISNEVVTEGLSVLDATSARFGFTVRGIVNLASWWARQTDELGTRSLKTGTPD